MEKGMQRIPFTHDLRPAYYDDFHCLMGDCRQSCCKAAWKIGFNRKDYLKIKKQKGSPELNAKLEHCLKRLHGDRVSEKSYAEFVTHGVVCPLLSEEGLCLLQREKGPAVLPNVCQTFPRRNNKTQYLERSLSPACEGVLALLWDLPEGVEFRSDPLPQNEQSVRALPESNVLAKEFQNIRSLCIDFLQDRRKPLSHRLLLMGLALKDLADGETDISRFIEKGRAILERGDAGELLKGLDGPQALNLALLNSVQAMFVLRTEGPAAREALQDMGQWLSLEMRDGHFRLQKTAYLAAKARFEEQFADRAYFMENLMVSLFFYLGLPKVDSPEDLWKSYVNFCNLYAAYHFTAVMSCREGAPGDRDELFRLLVILSRALLHSQMNQNRLLDNLFQHDSATLAHMAILLCGA